MIIQTEGVNYFGFERIDEQGKRRRNHEVIRTKGVLTLTSVNIRFNQTEPPGRFEIPVDKIARVGTAVTHNGRSFGFLPVLQVAFVDEGGSIHVLGVCVGRSEKTQEWIVAFERILTGAGVPTAAIPISVELPAASALEPEPEPEPEPDEGYGFDSEFAELADSSETAANETHGDDPPADEVPETPSHPYAREPVAILLESRPEDLGSVPESPQGDGAGTLF